MLISVFLAHPYQQKVYTADQELVEEGHLYHRVKGLIALSILPEFSFYFFV
jgi:hypothetical protein